MKLQYFLAWNDPLTLLPNRAAFMTRLERLAKESSLTTVP